jgi:hypothetical protein
VFLLRINLRVGIESMNQSVAYTLKALGHACANFAPIAIEMIRSKERVYIFKRDAFGYIHRQPHCEFVFAVKETTGETVYSVEIELEHRVIAKDKDANTLYVDRAPVKLRDNVSFFGEFLVLQAGCPRSRPWELGIYELFHMVAENYPGPAHNRDDRWSGVLLTTDHSSQASPCPLYSVRL